jgi:predicted O-methyltransferase YrrM
MDPHFGHNPGASHTAALLACVLHTEGPVIELGVGAFSTPLLHAVAQMQQRTIVSLENNPEYYQYFKQYHTENHAVVLVDSYDDYAWETSQWDVMLIDHLPSLSRSEMLLRLHNKVRLFVAHDTEDQIPTAII